MGKPIQLDAKVYRPEPSRIVFSTDAKGLMSRAPARPRMDASEEKAQADIMSVALNNPDRRGSSDKRAGDPLWIFCQSSWKADYDHARDMWRAGVQFGNVCRRERTARELDANGTSVGEGDGAVMSEAEIAAARAAAIRKYDEARYVLRGVMERCPRRMELMCYDLLEPMESDRDMLKNGLWRLAVLYDIVDLGINREKSA